MDSIRTLFGAQFGYIIVSISASKMSKN